MRLIIEGPEKKLAKIARLSRAFGITSITKEETADSLPDEKTDGEEKPKKKTKK